MRILLILISLTFITATKADEIYNLLKIPNLEVYKISNENGILYLNTKKDFKIGLGGNVTCNKSNLDNDPNQLTTIEKNLEKYQLNFLKKNNIKYTYQVFGKKSAQVILS